MKQLRTAVARWRELTGNLFSIHVRFLSERSQQRTGNDFSLYDLVPKASVYRRIIFATDAQISVVAILCKVKENLFYASIKTDGFKYLQVKHIHCGIIYGIHLNVRQ